MELTEELEIGQLYEWSDEYPPLLYILNNKGLACVHRGDILLYLGITYEFHYPRYKYKFLFKKMVCILDKEECECISLCSGQKFLHKFHNML